MAARRNVYYAAFRSVNDAAAQTHTWPPPTSPPLAEDALNSRRGGSSFRVSEAARAVP